MNNFEIAACFLGWTVSKLVEFKLQEGRKNCAYDWRCFSVIVARFEKASQDYWSDLNPND